MQDTIRIWCGPEGWLTGEEFVERTRRGIEAYAKMQPLRYRSAMIPRLESGAKRFFRKKPQVLRETNQKPRK